MPKKYIVRLTDAEREMLNGLIKQRRAAAQKVLRAHVLLKADADGPHWTDAGIANAFDCRMQTIENIRERFVTERLLGPRRGLHARFAEHPRADRHDEPALLRDRQELVGREHAAHRVLPPQQRFEPDDLRRLEADERLIVHVELVADERTPER